jgi:hypothetical protein
MNDPFENLAVFFGDASSAEARVYARLPMTSELAGCRLTGYVVGPSNAYTQTLSAKLPLVDRGPRASLVAEAIVPDPCGWTPASPFQYRVDVELRRGTTTVAKTSRMVGIRALGALGKQLIYEGRSWSFRAASRHLLPSASAALWRNAGLAVVIDDKDGTPFDESFFEEASRLGTLLALRTSRKDSDLRSKVDQMARFPCAAIVIVTAAIEVDAETRSQAPNVLWAQQFADEEPIEIATWASLAVCEGRSVAEIVERSRSCQVPVIPFRPASSVATIHEARAAIAELESDLAGLGDFAGFIV